MVVLNTNPRLEKVISYQKFNLELMMQFFLGILYLVVFENSILRNKFVECNFVQKYRYIETYCHGNDFSLH